VILCNDLPVFSPPGTHCTSQTEEMEWLLIRDWLPHSRFYGYARHWRRSPLIGLQFSAFSLCGFLLICCSARCRLLLSSWPLVMHMLRLFNLLRTPHFACAPRPTLYSIYIPILYPSFNERGGISPSYCNCISVLWKCVKQIVQRNTRYKCKQTRSL